MTKTAEKFNFANATQVVGISGPTLQTWEARGYYVPDRVRCAQWCLDHSVFPAYPPPKESFQEIQTERQEVVDSYRRGHRSYSVSDLIRISLLRRLTFAGVAAAEASSVVSALNLADTSSRDKARSLHNDPAWDAWLVFIPEEDLLVPMEPTGWVERLWVAGEKPNAWRFAFTARGPEALAHVLARTRGRAAVVINLSAVIRELLARLDDLFPAVTSGGAN